MWRAVAAEKAKVGIGCAGLAGLVDPEGATRAVMISIKGHEIRSSRLAAHEGVLAVAAGDMVEFVGVGDEYYKWEGGKEGDLVRIGLSYPTPGTAVKAGDVILVDDGTLRVKVTEVLGEEMVLGEALNAHVLKELSLVHVPHAYEGQEAALSARDIADLKFAAANHVDYVTVPFVRSGADVKAVRDVLCKAGGVHIKIVAQIDTREAIDAYDDILAEADAIMVSRTNLGMSIPAAKVALAQKWLIEKATLAGKPALVAGQVMEGMAKSPRPSRPEITDVVNAVYDGAAGIVLMQVGEGTAGGRGN